MKKKILVESRSTNFILYLVFHEEYAEINSEVQEKTNYIHCSPSTHEIDSNSLFKEVHKIAAKEWYCG